MSPRFLDLAEVLEIHQSHIHLHGGKEGIRDLGLLQSALAQPFVYAAIQSDKVKEYHDSLRCIY